MSIEYLNLAWSTPMPPLKKLVFISLADQANSSGACYPSIGYIEKRTGLSRRSVIRSIQWLEEQGFVSISRQDRSRNYYQINASATQTPSATVTPPSATQTPEGCHTDTRTSATQTPKPLRTINEPPKNQSVFLASLRLLGLPEDLIQEWMAIRKKKKAIDSERAFNLFLSEVEKAGITHQQAVELCCSSGSGWITFKSEYVVKEKQNQSQDGQSQLERVAAKLIREAEGGHQSITQTVPKITGN